MTIQAPEGSSHVVELVDGSQNAPSPAMLEVRGISKTFGNKTVLDRVNLIANSGEIHALLGQNGSGKSTLIKVLSGYHLPDPGSEVLVNGESMAFGTTAGPRRAGFRFVHQDLGLIESASVMDNIAYGTGYATRVGTIKKRALVRVTEDALRLTGVEIAPTTLVRELSPSQRTAVAVARALAGGSSDNVRVLVLDEPTATLPIEEVDQLLAMLRASAASGVAVVLVTHHLDEVFKIADRVTVLRDGRVVHASTVTEIDHRGLVEKLVGKELQEVQRRPLQASGEADGAAGLVVRGLHSTRVNGIDFAVKPGEVLGVYGLTGSGRETLLSSVFGAIPRAAGSVEVDGQLVTATNPKGSITAGIGYLPPDRKTHAGLMKLAASENMSLLDLAPFKTLQTIRKRKELKEVARWFEKLDIRPSQGIRQSLSSFSGGNQQKILLAKWLRIRPRALLLDEPTQGVDVGAKVAIHLSILEAAEAGAAVVVSSSDEDELASLCSRVIVMKDGRVADELVGDAITSTALTASIHAEYPSRSAAADPSTSGVSL